MSLVSGQYIELNTTKNKTHRYDETNEAGSQFPAVKTANPPVRRITIQEINANQLVYP